VPCADTCPSGHRGSRHRAYGSIRCGLDEGLTESLWTAHDPRKGCAATDPVLACSFLCAPVRTHVGNTVRMPALKCCSTCLHCRFAAASATQIAT
jgi:hypothetical protein